METAQILENLHRGGELLGERRWRRWKKIAQRSDNKGTRNGIWSRQFVLPVDVPVDRWRRPVDRAGRPACTGVHRLERSTGPGQPTEVACSQEGAVDRASRSWHGSIDRPVDRQTRLEFPFRIRIPFLVGIESNLGFHKSRDSVAINRG